MEKNKSKLADIRSQQVKKQSELSEKRHKEIVESHKTVAEAVTALAKKMQLDSSENSKSLAVQLKELKQVVTFKADIERLEKMLKAEVQNMSKAIEKLKPNDKKVIDAINSLATTYEENKFDPTEYSQNAKDYMPMRRVVRLKSGQYVFDDSIQGNSFSIGGGGSGGSSFPDAVLRLDGSAIAIVNPDGTPIAITVDNLTVDIGIIDNETPDGDVDGVNDTFTTFYDYKPGTTKLYLNGSRQREGLGYDYVEQGGNDFQFTTAPLLSDIIIIDYMKA